jgi:hypothetical protein
MKKDENGDEDDDEDAELKENANERSKINKKGYYEEQDEIKKRFLLLRFFKEKIKFFMGRF